MLEDQEYEIVKKCMNLALENLKIELSGEEKEELLTLCLEKGDCDAVRITKLVKKNITEKKDLSIKKELLTVKMSGWMNYPIYCQREGSIVSYVKRLKAVLAIDKITGNFRNYVLAKLDEKHMRVLENVKRDDMSMDEIIAIFEKMDDSTDSALLRLQHYEAEMTEESLTKLLDLFDRAHQNMSTVDEKHLMELKVRRVLEKYERNSHTWNKLFDHKDRIQSNQEIVSVLVPYWAFLKVNKNSKKGEKYEKFDKAKSGNQQQFSGKCHSCGIVGHRSKNCQVKKTEAVPGNQKKFNMNAKRIQNHDNLEERIRKLTEENEKQKLMIQRMIDERQEDFACMRVQIKKEKSSIDLKELDKDANTLKMREIMTGEEKGPVEFYLPVELER
uniref:CCHC-type domain-containing protein n=1 Tax=Strongyloides venezuelensis TaxID=75913 RepID=A0A0K0FT09_STRVS